MKKILLGCFLVYGIDAYAATEQNFASFTLDNDFFVNEDNGYTNGFFLSFYDVYENANAIQLPSFLVKPLMWAMPSEHYVDVVINVNSVGQTLTTAFDITLENPPQNSLPYSSLLSYATTYITVGYDYADWITTTLGVIGPIALGEQSQKIVHQAIGAQEPMGWDTQLKNELVFSLSRGRTWRSWVSDSGKMDILLGAEAVVGTIKSGVISGAMLRYGEGMSASYATALLASSRTSNPVAVENGWFLYGGLAFNYYFNQIFMDGNTFRDSRSVDYDHGSNLFTAGLSYAFGDRSISFAINTPFSLTGNREGKEIEKFTRYGTLTFAWKL